MLYNIPYKRTEMLGCNFGHFTPFMNDLTEIKELKQIQINGHNYNGFIYSIEFTFKNADGKTVIQSFGEKRESNSMSAEIKFDEDEYITETIIGYNLVIEYLKITTNKRNTLEIGVARSKHIERLGKFYGVFGSTYRTDEGQAVCGLGFFLSVND